VAKFVFRLESMKNYRSSRLLMAKKEMLRVEAQIHTLKATLQEAVSVRQEELEGSLRNLSYFAAAQLHSDLAKTQSEIIRQLEEEIKVVEEEFERNRAWVVQLGQELKIVEKLEEKQRGQFDAERLMNEKRKMDRWVAERRKADES